MLILTFSILVCSIGENTADVQVVIDSLEDIIILYKLRN
jgi:hypothetical protein